MSQRDEEQEKEWQRWVALLDQVENPEVSKDTTGMFLDIEVAEVISVGNWYMKPPEVAIVKDTMGNSWSIPEMTKDDGEMHGLVSRHDVRPGMRLRLKFTYTRHSKTEVFVVDPEPPAVVL